MKNIRVNYLKRTIKSTERYLAIPLWKFFLFMFGVCAVINGGLEIALHYKRGTDMTSMSFISLLFAQILIYAVVWTAVMKYIQRKELKKLKDELNEEEDI